MNGATILTKFTADTKDFDNKSKKVSNDLGTLTKGFVIGSAVTNGLSKAFGIVTNNMDNAINRIDTMNNFPKIMELFGVSADEADKSVKRIDKSVRGLPTSLDQAVSGVRDIFTVTKDLKKSEDMFRAINDSAMVFANGSTDAVNRFIYGYKQALSMGKVKAQEFNQMNEAIPGLMSKVAEALGVNYIELKEGLSDGTISIDQFNDALKTLDSEGVGSISSLQEAAKTSTGGIRTSITNMKTAFVRGVSNMLKSVNESLAPFGGLNNVMSSIGKTVENAFTKIGNVLKIIIPKLVVFYQFIKQNKTAITILAIALGSMYTSLKLLMFFNKVKMAINSFKLAIITTKAMVQLAGTSISSLRIILNLLNLSFLAMPIFWVIAGFTALIAGLVLLYKKCDWFRNFVNNLFSGIINFFKNNWKSVLLFLINPFVGAFNLLYTKCDWFRNLVNNFVTGIINFFKNNWKSILLFLVNPFAGAFSYLYNHCASFRNFVNSFVTTIVNWFKSIPSKLASVARGIVNAYLFVPKQMYNIGKQIVQGLVNGVKNAKQMAINSVRNLGSTILKGIRKVLGVHSPSTEFALVGKFSVLGFTEQLGKMKRKLQEQIQRTFAIDPSVISSNSLHYSPNVVNNININQTQDPLGRLVNTIKTQSGGARNDYNYGQGVA